MTVTEHELWNELLPLLKSSPIKVRGRMPKYPHCRTEIRTPQSPTLRKQLLDMKVNCVHCGALIHPARLRKADADRKRTLGAGRKGSLFYSGTCDLDINKGCSRSRAAKDDAYKMKSILRPDLIDPND